jgi:hypothetical protein
MNKETVTFLVCVTIIALAGIAGGVIYNTNDRNNMAKNIEAAINKGIDPLSVKCAYDTSSTTTCMVYSANAKK